MKNTTMDVSRENVSWLKKLRDKLGYRSMDVVLSRIRKIFIRLKLEGELK